MAITQETGSRLFGLLASALAVGISSTLSGPGYAQIAPQPGYGDEYGSVLQSQDQSNGVADLQQRLSGLGYYHGPVTGYFDISTQEAVRQFQQANGLAADGIVGTATLSALDGYGASQSSQTAPAGGGTLQLYDSGSQVSSLQEQLSQLGYYTGSLTGVFDDTTQAAVVNFQRARGLATDGIVGSATLAALSQPSATSAPVSPTYTATGSTPAATPSDGLLQLGDVGSEVSDLQSRLQTLGYYDGPISGSFGSQTQTALLAFQQAQGLTADGIAGPQVSAVLGGVNPTPSVAATSPTLQPAVQPTAVAPTVTPMAAPTITPTAPANAASVTPLAPAVSPSLTAPAPELAPTTASVQVPSLPPLPPADPSLAQSGRPAQSNSARQQAYRNPEGSRFGVSELQRRLEMRGFDPGQTGVYDSATQEAITKAQEAYGISGRDLDFQR
ncbi:MAG: peptidoglycan-binding protein [Elainella sp.]